jgi:UPF0755 protein
MRLFKFLVVSFLLLAILVMALGLWWLHRPLGLPASASEAAPLGVEIPAGSSAQAVAERLSEAGVGAPALLLYAWFRFSGESRGIKAGYYEIAPGTTPRELLGKLVRGEQALVNVLIVEGWTARQAIDTLRRSPDLAQDIEGLSGEQLMARIDMPGQHPEGRFFPDTYRVPKRTPVSAVLRQAARAMEQRLAEAWAQRSPDVPLRTPEEALVLASIVEKETGLASDRGRIAGVFSNRLRIGMRLQTDPSVIYGAGEGYSGNLQRRHLDTDTAYNTYTRAGLPPTPIALPGMASLMAAVRPSPTNALYFVSRGDGSSQFSATLEEHNAAVRRYILRR